MNIKKLLSNIPKHSSQYSLKRLSRLLRDPYIDWAFIAAIWFVLLIVLSGIGYWTFVQVSIQADSALVDESAMITPVFDEQKLNRVLEESDSRKLEWVQLKDGKYSFPKGPSS